MNNLPTVMVLILDNKFRCKHYQYYYYSGRLTMTIDHQLN